MVGLSTLSNEQLAQAAGIKLPSSSTAIDVIKAAESTKDAALKKHCYQILISEISGQQHRAAASRTETHQRLKELILLFAVLGAFYFLGHPR